MTSLLPFEPRRAGAVVRCRPLRGAAEPRVDTTGAPPLGGARAHGPSPRPGLVMSTAAVAYGVRFPIHEAWREAWIAKCSGRSREPMANAAPATVRAALQMTDDPLRAWGSFLAAADAVFGQAVAEAVPSGCLSASVVPQSRLEAWHAVERRVRAVAGLPEAGASTACDALEALCTRAVLRPLRELHLGLTLLATPDRCACAEERSTLSVALQAAVHAQRFTAYDREIAVPGVGSEIAHLLWQALGVMQPGMTGTWVGDALHMAATRSFAATLRSRIAQRRYSGIRTLHPDDPLIRNACALLGWQLQPLDRDIDALAFRLLFPRNA